MNRGHGRLIILVNRWRENPLDVPHDLDYFSRRWWLRCVGHGYPLLKWQLQMWRKKKRAYIKLKLKATALLRCSMRRAF
jgi:hypothetical protein